MAKIYEQGATDLIVGTLISGSFASSKKISGFMEISIEISEQTAKISADNDPGFLKLKGPAMGSGTIKMTAIPIEDYANLTSAISGKSSVIAFGEQGASIERGLCFKKLQYTDGAESINLVMLHNVVFGIPKEGSKSIDENGTEITECEIPFDIYPAFYTQGATSRRRTLTKINSSKSPALYDKLKDKCFTPSEASFEACDVTFNTTPPTATIVVKFGSIVISPNTEGTYSLTAGSYTYTASNDEYVTQADVELVIDDEDVTAGVKTVEVTLQPVTE